MFIIAQPPCLGLGSNVNTEVHLVSDVHAARARGWQVALFTFPFHVIPVMSQFTKR